MATQTKRTYDNTPEGIYNEALKRAKKEIAGVVTLVRSLGVTVETVADEAIMFKLIDQKEQAIIQARDKYIHPVEDPYSFANRRTVQAVQTPTVEAPVAPTAQSITVETTVVGK